jgi:hypothetical protein
MKFTLSWLKELLETDASAEQIAEACTHLGFELESLENPAEALKPFRIARVVEARAQSDGGRHDPLPTLVEAKAVRIGESLWAPLFTAVVEPNSFTATVEQARRKERPASLDEFWKQFDDAGSRSAGQKVVSAWLAAGHRTRLGPNHIVLEAAGPSKSGRRTVAVVYTDGHVMVPFHSYAGVNSGIPVDAVTTDAFRTKADAIFGFEPTAKIASTVAGWVQPGREQELLDFCHSVAEAYADALEQQS